MSMLKRSFLYGRHSMAYSLIAMCNVSVGLGVTALVWSQYSTSQNSDVLLLAISLMGILTQLSLLGVEQILYFYSDESSKNPAQGYQFFRIAFTWALISGLGFTVLFFLLSKNFVDWVATGFSKKNQSMVHHLMLCFSPQLIVSPCLHVIRAKWAIEERFGYAYVLSSVNAIILLACLIVVSTLEMTDLSYLGKVVLGAYSLFTMLCLWLYRSAILKPTFSAWRKIQPLLKQSLAIKGANAVHNFLVQALVNSLLSQLPTGSVSIFQYGKKLADGVFAITAGPQVLIYHSKCAQILTRGVFTEFRLNALYFLKTFISSFFFMALLVFVLTPIAMSVIAQQFTPEAIGAVQGAYSHIVLWYFLIGLETLAVGIVLAVGQSAILFSVNLLFITLLYFLSRLHINETVNELILTVVGCQMLSFVLFISAAIWIVKRRSEGAS